MMNKYYRLHILSFNRIKGKLLFQWHMPLNLTTGLFVSYHVHLQLTTHRVCDISTHPFESGLESAKQKIVVGFSLKSLSILARNILAPGKSIARILRKSTPRDTIRSTTTCRLSSLLYLTDNNSKLFFLLD